MLPALVAWTSLLLPIAVLVSLSHAIDAEPPGGAALPIAAAVTLLVLTLALLYVCYRLLPALRLPRRIVVDDTGVRIGWWWSRRPHREVRWTDGYEHDLFLERHEVTSNQGARRIHWYENHRFRTASDELWVRLDRGEPHPTASSLPDDAPWLRPTIHMAREQERFFNDPRIRDLRQRYL